MPEAALVASACLLAVWAWTVHRRRRSHTLDWSPDLTIFQMARKCQAFLRLHGIDAIRLDPSDKTGPRAAEGPVSLRVKNDQFNGKLPIIKIICRDSSMHLGETFFKDISERRTKNNDWKSLVLVIRAWAPNPMESHFADKYCVAVIRTAELHDFAQALQAIKAGAIPATSSASPTLARTLKTGSIGLVTKLPA